MKKFTLKNIFLSFAILLAFCSILILPTGGEIEKVSSYASYTRVVSPGVVKSESQEALYTPNGNLPFSLYTSLKNQANNTFDIVDYHPTFTASTQNQGTSQINYYSMNPDSIPYVLLSSYNGRNHASPEKENFENLYNTTLFFKFNDQTFKGKEINENIISPDIIGRMSVTATVNGQLISTPINESNNTTTDATLEFAVNLKDIVLDPLDAHCPILQDNTLLGGDGKNNDVSFRTGLYSFQIRYVYKDVYSNVSNECVFEISFYVLDYYTYVKDADPIAFENTDAFTDNYEIFNYNYTNSPFVMIDTTKFALNFVYTTGYINYEFTYDSFAYSLNCTPDKVFKNASLGDITGTITLKLKDSDLFYTVNTYMDYAKNKEGSIIFNDLNENRVFDKDEDKNNNGILDAGEDLNDNNKLDTYGEGVFVPYYARFDLKDFETNFLIPNKINTTFLGQYSFDLDFLVQTNTGYSVFSNDKFDNYPAEINKQKLVLFGYNLKYYDQDSSSATYGKNVELKNDATHTNFVAYNSATVNNPLGTGADNTGALLDIPQYIAVTNQAPLRFDYYGNLSHFSASFANIAYQGADSHSTVLGYFDVETLKQLETNTNSLLQYIYTQGASISNDNIRIMKLVYDLSVDVGGTPATIQGVQYVVFEINNTVQNLYVQGVDNNRDGSINKLYDFKNFTNKNVLVSIEDKPNTFFAPFNVTYNYYSGYKTDGSYTTGVLSLKQSGNKNESLAIDTKKFNYYVTSNANSYTFTNSGAYKVCIRNSITNTPSYYYFTIDKENFNGISFNKASLTQDGNNYTLDTALISSLLTNTSNAFVNTNLLVTSSSFTLSWLEKQSGAKSYSYVYYMDLNKQSDLENNMIKSASAEYWITNGSLISSPSSAIDTFKNHAKRAYKNAVLRTKILEPGEYFTKDGLYIFYVYDEAGNFFTRSILIDTSKANILQGKWDGVAEQSDWVNTYDPENNPSNYVDEDTTLYFGTHKALQLPNLSDNTKGAVSFEDISFTREYFDNNGDGIYDALASKTPITFNIYSDILLRFSSFIKSDSNATVLVGSKTPHDPYYYLTVPNKVVNYFMEYETGNDESGAATVAESRGQLSNIKSATIYKIKNPADIYRFYGEAYYKFDLENANGASLVTGENDEGAISARIIQMNFDKIQGTFKAYGDSKGDFLTEHEVRKNSGTNLNVLNFEYKNLEAIGDQLAKYYSVAKLTFDYYAFVLDDSSQNSSKTAYPFASTATSSNVDLLIGKVLTGDKVRINAINIDASGKTMPGKYILTRTYVGGTHNIKLDAQNRPVYEDGKLVYEYVGTGGSFVQQIDENGNPIFDEDGDPKYENLFEFDTLERKYTVYVDHNGIITTSYMIRDDKKPNIREVGDNISITLSNTYDDEWTFKEFFLTSSSTLALNTNKVPIKVNIPLSKYFVYFYSNSNNQYAKQSFARLEIKITYYASASSPAVYYIIDSFDSSGLCTCSKLVSNTNPLGQLIFSASGNYIIDINDRTGYTDPTSSDKDADNKVPTSYSYSFSISHTNPDADTYTNTYFVLDSEFELKKLTNEDGSYNFATNIKKENGDLDGDGIVEEDENNQALISWSDPLTPYQAKVNQFDIRVVDKENKILATISIDLKEYQLIVESFKEVAQTQTKELSFKDENAGADVKGLTLPVGYNNYLLFFKVVPYRELVSSEDLVEETDNPPKNMLNISTYDHTEYYRYSYIVGLDISHEYRYEITLSYIADSTTNQEYEDEHGNSFAESLYTLTIDRTKPNTNIDKLLNEESYLDSSGYYDRSSNLFNFKEENFDVPNLLEEIPSAFTYAFGLSDNFALTYDQNDTSPYFYVRGYDKFNGEYTSITPDMIDSVYDISKAYYTDFTHLSVNYPRFSEVNTDPNIISIGGNLWYKIYYKNGTPLKQQLTTAMKQNPSGFYEIIEKDNAGNFRNFTIYYNKYTSLFQNLEIDGYTQKDNAVYRISKGDDAQKDNISAGVFFEASKLSTTLGWGTITVANATTSINYDQEIVITPFDSPNDIIDSLTRLNDFLDCELSSKLTFMLKKYNSTYSEPSLTRHINLLVEGEAKLDRPIIEEVLGPGNTISYNLVLPTYNSKTFLYLEDFSLQRLSVTNTWVTIKSFTGKGNIPNRITSLEKGIYKAIYKDNFNDLPYSHPLYLGEKYINDFNKEYTFEFDSHFSTTENINGNKNSTVHYSGGYIDVTYEANIYKVYLSINGSAETLISGTALESDSPIIQNCKTFRLSPTLTYNGVNADLPVGGKDTYTLIYVDIIDNSIVEKAVNFIIFNALPEINLSNAYGDKIYPTLEENESQAAPSKITVSWGDLDAYGYDSNSPLTEIVATLYTRNENGEYKNGIRINKNQVVTEEGFYKLALFNKILGNFREIYFAISFDTIPLYTIKDNGNKLSASTYEKLDFTAGNAVGGNTSIVEKICKTIEENITVSESDKKLLQEQIKTIANITNVKHFYTTGGAKISYNRNIELNIIEFMFSNNKFTNAYLVNDLMSDDKDTVSKYLETGISGENPMHNNVASNYITTIFLVYDLDGPIIVEFFALTKVPKTSALVKNLYYDNEKANTKPLVNLNTNPVAMTLTNSEIVDSNITLYWNALPNSSNIDWYNAGNVIILEDTYGVDTEHNDLACTINPDNSQLKAVLVGSGLHKLVFKDLAGNIHEFAPTSYSPQKYYSLLLLDSVIYNINYKEKDLNPIQHGVFNESLSVVLNTEYLTYYSELNVLVTRNGNSYNDYETNENIYTFTTPGRYTVTMSALYGSQKTPLNNAIYNFTILSSNSARLAYEFVEVAGYEILDVTRNGQNITSTFDKDGDGKVLSLFVSSTAGGNGYYSVKLKYGARSTQVLQFNFTINDYIPTISSNVAHGETTQGSIVISYNPSMIYEQLGECYIKVLTYNNDSKTFFNYATITIDENSFTGTNAKSFEITRSNSYFIQVQTKNGNVISSFRVNKTDPLNTMAIIIIVIAVIATIVLIIVIVKLRTRMKIR